MPRIPLGKVVRECNDRIIYIKKIGLGCIPLPRVYEGREACLIIMALLIDYCSQYYYIALLIAMYQYVYVPHILLLIAFIIRPRSLTLTKTLKTDQKKSQAQAQSSRAKRGVIKPNEVRRHSTERSEVGFWFLVLKTV